MTIFPRRLRKKKPEKLFLTAEEEAQLLRPPFKAIVVPPQPQTSRIRGLTIHRDNSGPDYAEIKLKKGNQELVVFRLAKNEIFNWTGDIILHANETVTLESTTQFYIDNVMFETMASLDWIHQSDSGNISFATQQPMPQYVPPQLPYGQRIPLPDKYIPAPEPAEKKEPDIDPRIKGLIDSLEEKKKK